MDTLITSFADKLDAPKLLADMTALSEQYKQSGINRENISGLVAKLMMDMSKLNKLSGSEKKQLVTGVIFHFIEQIEEGDKDSEFETLLKALVPSMIDAFSVMLKLKNVTCCF